MLQNLSSGVRRKTLLKSAGRWFTFFVELPSQGEVKVSAFLDSVTL
jgi:hypothetical protein